MTLGVVFAATGGGTVYAIAAQDTNGTTGIAPGTVLWKTHLGNPYGGIDGNSIGVLSAPIIDIASFFVRHLRQLQMQIRTAQFANAPCGRSADSVE